MTDYETVKKDLDLNDDEIDFHETDLYVKYSPEREAYFEKDGWCLSFFHDRKTGRKWIDVPFFLLSDELRRKKKERDETDLKFRLHKILDYVKIQQHLHEKGFHNEANSPLMNLLEVVQKFEKEIEMLLSHRHQWNEESFCSICGIDGNS